MWHGNEYCIKHDMNQSNKRWKEGIISENKLRRLPKFSGHGSV